MSNVTKYKIKRPADITLRDLVTSEPLLDAPNKPAPPYPFERFSIELVLCDEVFRRDLEAVYMAMSLIARFRTLVANGGELVLEHIEHSRMCEALQSIPKKAQPVLLYQIEPFILAIRDAEKIPA